MLYFLGIYLPSSVELTIILRLGDVHPLLDFEMLIVLELKYNFTFNKSFFDRKLLLSEVGLWWASRTLLTDPLRLYIPKGGHYSVYV